MTPEAKEPVKTDYLPSFDADARANGNGAMLATVHLEPTRRGDVDARQMVLARILAHAGCDWGLIFEPANIRWLTGGLALGEFYPAAEQPILFQNLVNRSVVCTALDTQALFDTDLDDLGFGIKEHPWYIERADYLRQLVHNRKVASDRHFLDCVDIAETLQKARAPLSAFEQKNYRELGRLLAHAIEATARNIAPGETEIAIAGQLGHRLLKHAVLPLATHILGDDRPGSHPRGLPTEHPVRRRCLIQATASRNGLFASASRTVCFGHPSEEFKANYDQACRLQTIHRAKARPGELVKTCLRLGQSFLLDTPFEHDWRRTSFGCRIGRSSMEGRLLHAGASEPFVVGVPIAWETSLGIIRLVETVLPHADREEPITGPQEWPIRRVRLPDQTIALPDYLVVDS